MCYCFFFQKDFYHYNLIFKLINIFFHIWYLFSNATITLLTLIFSNFFTAPSNVRIEGNLSVNQGDQLNLTCSYEKISPSAKLVVYKIDEKVVQISNVVSNYISFEFLS